MNRKTVKIFGIIGAIIMSLGVFMPWVWDFGDSTPGYLVWSGFAVLLLSIASIIILFVLKRKNKGPVLLFISIWALVLIILSLLIPNWIGVLDMGSSEISAALTFNKIGLGIFISLLGCVILLLSSILHFKVYNQIKGINYSGVIGGVMTIIGVFLPWFWFTVASSPLTSGSNGPEISSSFHTTCLIGISLGWIGILILLFGIISIIFSIVLKNKKRAYGLIGAGSGIIILITLVLPFIADNMMSVSFIEALSLQGFGIWVSLLGGILILLSGILRFRS